MMIRHEAIREMMALLPPVDSVWMPFERIRRAIVVVDMVESVRLIEANELGTVLHWRRFVDEVRANCLPPHGGRLVKSLGDGMLLEFRDVPGAVCAALAMRELIDASNQGLVAQRAVKLRMGIHIADVLADELDVYGAGVNLAARLAGLAGPNEIVISADARAQLVDGLDADVEDLGDCFLKHVSHSIRAFKLGAPGAMTPPPSTMLTDGGRETIGIAVMPFEERGARDGDSPMGHMIADDVIAKLSRFPQLRVISRLSTAAFHRRSLDLEVVASTLSVDYILHGSIGRSGRKLRLSTHLVEVDDQHVIWSESFEATERAILFGAEAVVDSVVQQVCATIVGAETQRAATRPLPSLGSYTILLGAVSLLHSLSAREFERSREMLSYLIDRHPKQASPRAWMGLWHVMRVGQGWSGDAATDAAQGRAQVSHALTLDPRHSLSLAVDGLISAYVHKDLAAAGASYDAALQSNPSESLAWLYKSAWHAYREGGDEAVAAALRARSLSPLDPLRYYYDNFTSTAMLAANNLDGAIRYGTQSLRANRMHGPTLRILAIAHALAGDLPAARETVAKILAQEPGFSIKAFRARYPGRGTEQVERYARALSSAGLPP